MTTGTGFGNGWGTLNTTNPNSLPQQPQFFVEYHGGIAEQFLVNPKVTDPSGLAVAQPIGLAYYAQVLDQNTYLPNPTGSVLAIEIDTSLIVQPGTSLPTFVNANWITAQFLAQNPAAIGTQLPYDGIGPQGNNFFQVPLGVNNSWISGVGTTPSQPLNTTLSVRDPNINMTNWRIDVREQ